MILSCPSLADWAFAVHGIVNLGNTIVGMCCEANTPPAVKLEGSPKHIVESVIALREDLIKNPSICKNCPRLCSKEWEFKHTISLVNIASYPAPCQSKCVYCKYIQREMLGEGIQEGYELVFQILEYLKTTPFVDKNTIWQFASGEMTIHPYKKRMHEIIGNQLARYLTNGFIFDKQIANNIKTNLNSRILCSLDAGTKETFYKVKGHDIFNTVVDNLHQYRKSREGGNSPVHIKYIMLPEINDNARDFNEVLDLIYFLGGYDIAITTDYQQKNKNRAATIKAISSLIKMALERELLVNVNIYSNNPAEIEEITQGHSNRVFVI